VALDLSHPLKPNLTRPTIILSDTHFGDPRRSTPQVADLIPIIEQAGHLIINGDVAELQYPALQARAARQVLDLQAVCDRLGVQLTLLSGNHDAFLEDRRYLTLNQGQILVTHGDVIHPAVVPWSDAAKWFREKGLRAIRDLGPERAHCLEGRLEVARFIGHHEFVHSMGRQTELKTLWMRPRLLGSILWYWLRAPHYAARFVEHCMPEAKVFVFGHSHRQGTWNRRGRLVINTGSFHFPGKPQAVVIEDNAIAVHRIQRRPSGLLQLSQPPARFFNLKPNPSSPSSTSPTNTPTPTHCNQQYLNQLAGEDYTPNANPISKPNPEPTGNIAA